MAYQVRGRDPLLDSSVQLQLTRRLREGLGVLLMGLGLVLGATLWSFHPDDPSWLVAADAEPRNWLGLTGASVAAPAHLVLGHGAWGVVAGLLAWGARFAAHRGAERVLPRALFVAAWALLLSVYFATTPPPPGWAHDYGLGGLLGDQALGLILTAAPIDQIAGLRIATLLIALATLVAGAWVLGVDRAEARAVGRFLLQGLGTIWHGLGLGAGRVAGGAVRGGRAGLSAWSDRRAARAEPGPDAEEFAIEDEDEDAAAPAPGPGWLARLRLRRRRGEVGGGAPGTTPREASADDPEDRVRARISSAVRSRARRAGIAAALSAPPAPRGPTPQGAPPAESEAPVFARSRREPPLTAAQAPERVAPVPRAAPDSPPPARAPLRAALEEDAEGVIETPPPAPHPSAPPPQAAPVDRAAPVDLAAPPAPPRPTPGPSAAPASRPAPEADADGYALPPLDLLRDPATIQRLVLSEDQLEENARLLMTVLTDYGVKGEIVNVSPGPVVTMYELEPAPGLKASRVIGLADDIARSMSALSARVSTVPGRSVIGIELPNDMREMVALREILTAPAYGDPRATLPLALGKDIGGAPVVANLAKMPHLLIAGTTGSGKSVAINTMILSLLYRLTPEECRLIMIDPKMLELSVYDGIPHLLSPVVTDPKKAVVALKWVVGEMEDRYRKMSKMGVRNIDGYNARMRETLAKGEMITRTVQTGFDDETGDPVFETEEDAPQTLPYIVVVVDEMADLMMVAGKEIEACIQRLAQMARASGIHIIMATQRPSVDVITGTVKANFPTRISFHVTSKIDSRTILGEMGAEQLLGMGDMLYMAGGSRITRVHGPFCSDEEVEEIVSHLKAYGPPDYAASVLDGPDEEAAPEIDAVLGLAAPAGGAGLSGDDALYDQAVAIVAQDRKCSTSYVQRKLGIGYNKAARLVERMETEGVVSAANQVGKREILVPEPR
jgi:S-DNA-T family DNA segregation ATPase FtsK/SpoIIIE